MTEYAFHIYDITTGGGPLAGPLSEDEMIAWLKGYQRKFGHAATESLAVVISPLPSTGEELRYDA